jgi:hypothetical protein
LAFKEWVGNAIEDLERGDISLEEYNEDVESGIFIAVEKNRLFYKCFKKI